MPSYIPNLGGVLVAHSNAHYLRKEGLIDGDSAFSLAPVSFDAIVWRPELGMELGTCGYLELWMLTRAEGSIALSSPSHVSLLLHGTFNAAISAAHLPSSRYEFVSGTPKGASKRRSSAQDRSVGYWRHKKSGEPLGGEQQTLRFTVISMTIANHMLSLHGSLLSDPFSVPPPKPGSQTFDQNVSVDLEEEAAPEAAPEAGAVPVGPRRVRWADDEDEVENTGATGAVEPQDDATDADESDGHAMDDESGLAVAEHVEAAPEFGRSEVTEKKRKRDKGDDDKKEKKKDKKGKKEKKGKGEKKDKKEKREKREKKKSKSERSSHKHKKQQEDESEADESD